MPTITLENLTKSYEPGSPPAVNGIDLTVKDGDFLCLLGPSGCGKTTILRMIAGIEHSSDGEISIDNQVVDSIAKSQFIPPEKRQIGLVFQNYALWPHMTVERNVDFGLRLQKVPAKERSMRCLDVMKKLRIEEYADRFPSQLSGGQQQRVALARMLAVNPEVLLLDEPLSNLDAVLRLEMRAELKRIHETFGTTIVFVSHDQWEAMTLAKTIVVMNKGQIQQIGTPDDIYAEPNNSFVAEFIGNPRINMISLSNANGAQCLAEHFSTQFNLPQEATHCGIRPESILLSDQAHDNTIAVTIESVMPTGGSWVIELSYGCDRIFYSTQSRPNLLPSEQGHCILPYEALHLFNKLGQRITAPHTTNHNRFSTPLSSRVTACQTAPIQH